jgi:hypothetical protein
MDNDSLETLLLRHYGPAASTPPALEQQLVASVRQEAEPVRRSQQQIARDWRTTKISRRRALRLVALGSAGAGIIGLGIEGLHTLETGLLGADSRTQSALS